MVRVERAESGQVTSQLHVLSEVEEDTLSGQNVFCCGSPDMDYIRLSQSFVGKAKYFIWKIYS